MYYIISAATKGTRLSFCSSPPSRQAPVQSPLSGRAKTMLARAWHPHTQSSATCKAHDVNLSQKLRPVYLQRHRLRCSAVEAAGGSTLAQVSSGSAHQTPRASAAPPAKGSEQQRDGTEAELSQSAGVGYYARAWEGARENAILKVC